MAERLTLGRGRMRVSYSVPTLMGGQEVRRRYEPGSDHHAGFTLKKGGP